MNLVIFLFSLYATTTALYDNPNCFNCNLNDYSCVNFGVCSQNSGRCLCPVGFGGDRCNLTCNNIFSFLLTSSMRVIGYAG
jgi:hypothetical protein